MLDSRHRRPLAGLSVATCLAIALPQIALADGGVTFHDIAAGDTAGITYRRVPSASNAVFDQIKLDPPYDAAKRLATPLKARGAPGVALLDHDGDGDLDIYATNGPGVPNSLYSNQLRDTGQATFVDVGGPSGAGATDLDSTGVCFGDIDNDGDPDLYVLGKGAPNRLFENQGDGTFADITATAGTGGGALNPSGCSMGDVNGDGLLDIAIANTFDWSTFQGIFEAFTFDQHNQLFLNAGGNRFEDVSASSGIQAQRGFPVEFEGSPSLTWALALVDMDLDGDLDLITADDQGGVPPAATGGIDRGLLHLFENDGTGHFTDITVAAGTNLYGSWMGLSFGDFNCDGTLDLFGSNFGDYQPVGTPEPGLQPSRWLLQRADGTFEDPGVGDFLTTPFGWGTATFDYDNDGDTDIVFHGGHDLGPGIELGNRGVLLRNQGCAAQFVYDREALQGSTDHNRRVVHGVAVGDLDDNGFPDIVSVSNLDIQESLPLTLHRPFGSVFDQDALLILNFEPDGNGDLIWNGNVYPNGTLAVELSSGDNGNGSVQFELVGGSGLTPQGRVNRDGIGAVVKFRPSGGEAVMRPIVGGSSYASQNALAAHFGLGTANGGTVEVLWPGGVRNRLYNVLAGERIIFPEIPCSFDQPQSFRAYLACTVDALDGYVQQGTITRGERTRFLMSALRAFAKNSSPNCSAKDEGIFPLLRSDGDDSTAAW